MRKFMEIGTIDERIQVITNYSEFAVASTW